MHTPTGSLNCRFSSLLWLGLLGLLLLTGSAEAGVLDLSWDAPITNTDGTALTDLSTYNLYAGTIASCPGTPFQVIPSPEIAPASGDLATAHLTGLMTGAQYVVQVTAVNAEGAESVCSAQVIATAKSDGDIGNPRPGGTPPPGGNPRPGGTPPPSGGTPPPGGRWP